MTWLTGIALAAATLATMRAALERGDLDEAARQGALAGPVVVERGLAASDRVTRLAAIAAAPIVEDRAELLDALARAAAGPDRRTAIPAASAARTIARELSKDLARRGRPDDLADDDLAGWRATWSQLAMRGDRWIELRLVALDTAAALDPAGTGVELTAALRDPDPGFRLAAATIGPLPAAPASYAALAGAVIHDADPAVALGAAQSLCAALAPPRTRPVLAALGDAGLARIRAILATDPRADRRIDPIAARDAGRCLAAGGSPASAAAPRAPGPPVRQATGIE
jgi:hypothetical protein